jgi:Na+-translocating ferredoxin:NAD+ oxidoreductase RnfG subunit
LRRFKFGILSLVATIVCCGNLFAQTVPEKADAAMRRVFPDAATYNLFTVSIDSAATAHLYARTGQIVRGRVMIRQALNAKGKPIGFGITDDVKGKEQPITYITLIKPDGSIADVEILLYREAYGGEIQHEGFRKQFRGENASSDIRLGHDIQSIAGATISSRAITNGARKLVTLFDELHKEGKF